MIRAIAVDDEPKALKIIENHIAKINKVELLKSFNDPFLALQFLDENEVNLLFLDIQMPEMTGLELAKIVKNKNIEVIFTTAYDEYAVESYEIEVLDYLLKPFTFSRFHKAVLKTINHQKLASEFIFVNDGKRRFKIFIREI